MPRLSDFKINESTPSSFKVIHYSPWDELPTGDEDRKMNIVNSHLNAKELSLESERGSKGVQNGFNRGSKGVQKGFKRGSIEVQEKLKKGSKGVQKGFKRGSKGVQEELKRGSDWGSEKSLTKSQLNSISVPTDAPVNIELSISEEQEIISILTGSQKDVLFNIVEICCSKGTLITPPLQRKTLAKQLGIPYQTIKTVFRRLVEKRIVKKQQNKRGVGGFCCFKITESVKSYVLENRNLFSYDRGSDKGSNKGSSSTYVSSSYINTTTTKEEEKNISNLPTEWSHIDYSALEAEGFNESRLIQIHRAYKSNPDICLTPDIIQDSITHFAYDLEYNNIRTTFKHHPIAVLTSILKKGSPYTSKTPDQVKTSQEIAMAKYLQHKNAADARIKEMEEDWKKIELALWLNKIKSDELLERFADPEKLQLIKDFPTKDYYRTIAHRSAQDTASEYFFLEVWPAKRLEVLEERKHIELEKQKKQIS